MSGNTLCDWCNVKMLDCEIVEMDRHYFHGYVTQQRRNQGITQSCADEYRLYCRDKVARINAAQRQEQKLGK